MAVKTNCNKNGSDYFRVSAVLGTDSRGKRILKEFYGKSKSEAEAKKREYLEGIKKWIKCGYEACGNRRVNAHLVV